MKKIFDQVLIAICDRMKISNEFSAWQSKHLVIIYPQKRVNFVEIVFQFHIFEYQLAICLVASANQSFGENNPSWTNGGSKIGKPYS